MVDDLVACNPESTKQRWSKGRGSHVNTQERLARQHGDVHTYWCGWRRRRRGPLAWEPPSPSAECRRAVAAWGPLASPAHPHPRPLKTERQEHEIWWSEANSSFIYLIYKLTYVIISWIRVLLFTVVSTIIIHVDLQRDISTLIFLLIALGSHLFTLFRTLVAVLASPSEVMDFNSIFSFFSSSKGGFSLLWRFSGLDNLKEMDANIMYFNLSSITHLNPGKEHCILEQLHYCNVRYM